MPVRLITIDYKDGRGQDLNFAQTTGAKFSRFAFSLLSLLYLTCGSARIVVLTLEKQHVLTGLTR